MREQKEMQHTRMSTKMREQNEMQHTRMSTKMREQNVMQHTTIRKNSKIRMRKLGSWNFARL